MDFIEPCNEPKYDGIIKLKVFSGSCILFSDESYFWIQPNADYGTLGMEFFTSTCNVLVLDPIDRFCGSVESPKTP